ncbi:MAG: TIGR03013 family PEP-CTERM/XrtA system glycosyltransferase [Porticoccaceae bacterium]
MTKTNFRDLSVGYKILTVVEFCLYVGSIYFSLFLNKVFNWSDQPALEGNITAIYAIIFSLLILLTSLSLGLYNPRMRENFRSILRRVLISVTMGSAEFTLCTSLLLDLQPFTTEIVISSALLCLVLSCLTRYLAAHFDLLGFNKAHVLVLGSGERASIIEKRMRRKVDRHGFILKGFVVMSGDSPDGIQKEKRITLEKGALLSFVLENGIDEIVVACDERRNNLPVDELFSCKIRGISIVDILDFIERETGQIAVNLIYPSWVIYSNGFASTHYLRNGLDWIFNASMALIVLLVAWPAMLITILAIKLEEGLKAPIFYSQERVGQDGRIFRIVKFRSMRTDAESNGAVWATANDSRTTRVGNFIRKYRIDELPQIYNVFRGDMGFVGPRPERPEFVQNLIRNIPYYNERHNVKPGLTGWAQLKYPYGSSDQDALEKLKYDLYYIKHRSFLLDLNILLRTVEVVLFGKGR